MSKPKPTKTTTPPRLFKVKVSGEDSPVWVIAANMLDAIALLKSREVAVPWGTSVNEWGEQKLTSIESIEQIFNTVIVAKAPRG